MNGDAAAALRARWNGCGYYRTVGMRVTRVDGDAAEVALEVTGELAQPYGTAHGGAIAGLLDAAMGLAVLGRLSEDEGCTTVEMKLNYVRPAPPGPLSGRGRVLHMGRRTVVAAAEAHDPQGRMVACALGTFQRFPEPRS